MKGTKDLVKADKRILYWQEVKECYPEALKDFSYREDYMSREHIKINPTYYRIKLGEVTNTFVRMQLKEAPRDELVRMVKYAVILMDACKFKLDYKQAFDDLDIYTLLHVYGKER